MQSAICSHAAKTRVINKALQLRLITTIAGESLPSSADDYGAGDVRPSVFYFRRALRQAKTVDRAQVVGLAVCSELERLKAWVEDLGYTPPKWIVDPDEAVDRGMELEPPRLKVCS